MDTQNHDATILKPINFTPGNKHVVIGKGKKYCQHSGNLHLRNVVQSKLSMYLNANTKSSKSSIISWVLQSIRSEGGFVQLDKETGRWVETSEYLAREKTSQAFRDALRHSYKSSRENKRKPPLGGKDTPEALPFNSLVAETRRPCKRQRMDIMMTTTTLSSESSLEFPSKIHSTPATLANLIRPSSLAWENNDDEHTKNGDDLYTRMCSRLSQTTNAGSTNDFDPFEPTPLGKTDISEPLSIDWMNHDNHESQERIQDDSLLQSSLNVLSTKDWQDKLISKMFLMAHNHHGSL